ncbi:hypothetical protein GCM10010289_47810 [Streptomyces violascens]|uniref:Uncharacterized protein n=1 Tax=Streptomyces violascens TaxID=67381 RepID=A0ABQ3QQG6_9ACTN|nr:hypothetical protein GCM10010289_47810 [Streptomyces violascens]GHI39500.1 hypothetical protein Sviol_39080 [Streptomyces violascens]
MRLFDKLTGTKRPNSGVAPFSAEDVRAALLALNGPNVPYLVRSGTSSERADLVAEWRIREPAWHTFFARTQISRVLQVRLRIVPARHEVRALDRQWDVTWVGGTPTLAVSTEYTRGQVHTVSRRWTPGRGPDGGFEATKTFHLDSSEIKKPLQHTVLQSGWTWRGVVVGRL